jgi:hypothetical protein
MVQYVVKFGQYDESKSSTEFKLIFEDNEWRIDDFNNYKWRFEDYLKESNSQVEIVDSIVADSVR